MKPAFICLFALALTACAARPPSPRLLAPADPVSGLSKQVFTGVTADARSYELAEPLEWADLNKRVTPKEKQP
jgi:hypothetical protein